MHRLEHAGVGPGHVEVARCGEPDAAGNRGRQVREDVAEQVVVTTTSNRPGSVTRWIIAASMCEYATETSGYSMDTSSTTRLHN